VPLLRGVVVRNTPGGIKIEMGTRPPQDSR
jgi:hypothetical protein